MMKPGAIAYFWILSFLGCAAAVALLFKYVDVSVALHRPRTDGQLGILGNSLGSAVILSGEAVALMFLTITRLARGHLSHFGEALAVACVASICAYGVDSEVLKVFFGVPNPGQMMRGAKHTFNAWEGSSYSSFPSGHMALAAAFSGVFMRLYRSSIVPLSFLLLFASILLVVGGWHYPSDVLAGTYFGLMAGFIAGEVLIAHSHKAPL